MPSLPWRLLSLMKEPTRYIWAEDHLQSFVQTGLIARGPEHQGMALNEASIAS